MCVISADVNMETHRCSGCGSDLAIPALTTPSEPGESWWCEECVRRTLDAIERTTDGPEDELVRIKNFR